MQMYGRGIKRKMCKKSEVGERNVQDEQKLSKCMICLDVNESLEKIALRKIKLHFREHTRVQRGLWPQSQMFLRTCFQ